MDHRRLLLALVMALTMAGRAPMRAAPLAPPTEGGGGGAQPTILVLATEDFTRPWVRLIFDAFSTVVAAAPNSPAIYFEPLDLSRFQHPQYVDELREWLQRKYRDTHIDLVVPLGEDALGLLADARGEPWPGAGVLFLEAGTSRLELRSDMPQAGGVMLEDNVPEALATIKTILPQTQRLAVVYGAAETETMRWRTLVGKVKQAGLEPIELVGLSIEDLLASVARLPTDTAVMILSPVLDSRGHVIGPDQSCAQISATSRVPAFTLGAQDLGCGVVGGLMRDWSVVGRLLGREALARLRTPSDDVVQLPVAQYATLAFDERQLRRWAISERRLPAGSVVRYRQPSLWRDNRALVLTALAVTALQSLLIAGLVFERRRRRRAEIESRRNLTVMAHLDRRVAMGELATSLAHELNQPLNAILQNAGVAQMLLDANSLPHGLSEMTDIISDIRKDDIRASEVIRHMRGLLQKHELEARPVDLNEVAQDTIAIVRPDARARETQLEMEPATNVRSILGDRVHLQQVLLNLLMNALDAVATMPVERRRVRVSITAGAGEMRLAVTDSGIGIHADRTSEIFEPLFTTKSEGSGMGMGLAIALSIVEAHAGRMAAENNPEGGATVWFSLPVRL